MCPIAASEATYPFVHLADDRVDLGLTDLSTARRLRRCYWPSPWKVPCTRALTMSGMRTKSPRPVVSRFGAADRSGAVPEARRAVRQRLYLGSAGPALEGSREVQGGGRPTLGLRSPSRRPDGSKTIRPKA